MRWCKRKTLRKFAQCLVGGAILLVLLAAVGVQLGRAVFPVLDDHRGAIAEALSETLGVDVHIGAIEAEWVGLRPRLAISDVTIQSASGREILAIGEVEGELSLIHSLYQWQLVWRQLEFSQLHMQFQQADNGHWSLGGWSLTRTESDFQTPLDIFLLARHLTLKQSRFQFVFSTGRRVEFSIPQLMLENEVDFHRLTANLAMEGGKEAFATVIEGYGNPNDPENFRVKGYIALKKFPLEKVLAAWGVAGKDRWSAEHQLDTQLWFSGNPYRTMTLKGHLQTDGLPLNVPDKAPLTTGMSAQVTGRWQAGEGWHLGLQRVQVLWEAFATPEFNLVLRGAFNQPLAAAIDQIELGVWHNLAQRAGLLQGKWGEVLAGLQPEGRLTNIHLTQRPAAQGHFWLRANMHQVKVEAYRHAPAIAMLDGYIEASTLGGRVVVDSRNGFSMFYPKIYRQPMVYERASGELRWIVRQGLERVEVSSGRLRLSGEEGEGRGYIHLILPYGEKPNPAPQMTLLVGLRDSHARFHKKYVPYKVPDALYEWLQSSIKGGEISEAGFLWHGSLLKREGAPPPSIQLFGYVNQAKVRFRPQWPPLQQITGSLVLDNKTLDVQIQQAVLDNNRLQNISITLQPETEQKQPLLLHIVGKLQGDFSDALHLLRNSPIAKGRSAHWQGRGEVSAKFRLAIPLLSDPAAGQYDVQVTFNNAELQLPNLRLTLEKINGPLRYTSAQGLNSTGLDFTFWGRPASARLATERRGPEKSNLRVFIKGSLAVEQLAKWTRQPAVGQLAQGAADLTATINIPLDANWTPGRIDVNLNSDLTGVAIALPAPYGKTAQEKRPLTITASMTDSQLVRAAYGDLLRLQLLRNGQLKSGSLAFGSRFAPLDAGFLDVSGRFGRIDLQAWRPVLQTLMQSDTAFAGSAGQTWRLTPRFDLHLEALQLEQFALQQLYLTGEHRDKRWRVDVRSPQLYGEIFIFDDGRPLQVNLDSLRLLAQTQPTQTQPTQTQTLTKASEEPAHPVSLLKRMDLSRLPPVNFSTASLTCAGADYGAWSFDLRPIDGGIVLHDLQGEAIGLTLDGKNGGAELVWLQSQESNSTYLSGRVTTGNVGEVLQKLGHPKLLESESARFDLELLWPGAPDEVSLNQLAGTVTLELRNGRFIRGAEAGNNPLLRLIGLLNFDTLARRLKLDFSDLLKEGMAFDSVMGKLQFANGRILVHEPLRVESPSSTLQLAGVLNAKTEQIDASLVATLPVAGNLAVAAAFVGGLPAALGVYVVGKLFQEQVDQVSSIRYHISGSWDDPDIRVDKIFESSTGTNPAQLLRPIGDSREKPSSARHSMSDEPKLEARRPPQK